MKRTLAIVVRGKSRQWSFRFKGDPKYLAEWRADGLEVDEIVGTVPDYVVRAGFARLWFRAQGIWRWLRLW